MDLRAGRKAGAEPRPRARARAPGSRRAGGWRLAAALLAAPAALGSPAARAASMAFQGTLTLEFADAAIPQASITGAGVADLLAGPGGALATLAVDGGITGSAVVAVTDPDVSGTLGSVAATLTLGAGSLGPFHPPAPFGEAQLAESALPVRGLVRLCVLAAGCLGGPAVALTADGGARGVGVGGLLSYGGVGDVRISVQAAPWTVGTAGLALRTASGAAFTLPRAGFAHGPLSFTGSTALPGGELQLVTPIAVTSRGGGPLASFGVLTFRFLPEPGSPVLIASGALALAALGRWRRRGRLP